MAEIRSEMASVAERYTRSTRFAPVKKKIYLNSISITELALSIKESYPDLYQKRRTSEKRTNVYEMPLPWRPGWRNLVSGRALGGNRMGASTLFDYLKTIVQLLPYYIPPVVIANLINMIFFFFLLGAVEVIPILSGLLQKSANKVLNSKIETSLNVQQNFLVSFLFFSQFVISFSVFLASQQFKSNSRNPSE